MKTEDGGGVATSQGLLASPGPPRPRTGKEGPSSGGTSEGVTNTFSLPLHAQRDSEGGIKSRISRQKIFLDCPGVESQASELLRGRPRETQPQGRRQ